MKKQDLYYKMTYKYVHRIDVQRNKLMILQKDGIEIYNPFKNRCKDENRGLTMIDKSSKQVVK